jgi:hypothetical protein
MIANDLHTVKTYACYIDFLITFFKGHKYGPHVNRRKN